MIYIIEYNGLKIQLEKPKEGHKWFLG